MREIIKVEDLQRQIHGGLRNWGRRANSRLQIKGYSAEPLIEQALSKLAKEDSFAAGLLSARFIERKSISSLAELHHYSPDQINRKQRAAIQSLTLLVYDQLLVLSNKEALRKFSNLPPPPYDKLFGVDAYRKKMKRLLLDPSGNWCLAITGLGGIGKSALVNAVLREIAAETKFYDYLWLRFERLDLDWLRQKPDDFWTQFRHRLANHFLGSEPAQDELDLILMGELSQRPRVIVLDNLDDQPIPRVFALKIQQLTRPSKIVLTSRAGPAHDSDCAHISLREIEEAASEALIRDRVEKLDIPITGTEQAVVSGKILEVTGGNPLAIRLAVGLLLGLPVDQIPKTFAQSPGKKVEDMYRFVYEQSWKALSSEGRQLLHAMPLVAESGGNYKHLAAISDLPDPDLENVIQELLDRSLIELQGSAQEPRYGLHVLTESFLRSDVLNWL